MKLQNSKPGEMPDQCIIRCANNLLKAVVAAGYSLHSTPGVSGVDVHVYSHIPNEIYVQNVLSGLKVKGSAAFKVTFMPKPPDPDSIAEDEAARD